MKKASLSSGMILMALVLSMVSGGTVVFAKSTTTSSVGESETRTGEHSDGPACSAVAGRQLKPSSVEKGTTSSTKQGEVETSGVGR